MNAAVIIILRQGKLHLSITNSRMSKEKIVSTCACLMMVFCSCSKKLKHIKNIFYIDYIFSANCYVYNCQKPCSEGLFGRTALEENSLATNSSPGMNPTRSTSLELILTPIIQSSRR